MAVNLRQTHFRFGRDDGTEANHTWYVLEDVNAPGILVDKVFLVRFTEQETGGTALANCDAQFQYSLNNVDWVNITTTSAAVKAVAAASLTNGGNCTKRLSGTGTFESSGAGQTEDGTSGGTANDIAASGNSETECGLQIVGTQVNHGDTIWFRFTSPDATVSYDVSPSLTVVKPKETGIVSFAGIVSGIYEGVPETYNYTAESNLSFAGAFYRGLGDLFSRTQDAVLSCAGEIYRSICITWERVGELSFVGIAQRLGGDLFSRVRDGLLDFSAIAIGEKAMSASYEETTSGILGQDGFQKNVVRKLYVFRTIEKCKVKYYKAPE